MLYLSLVDVAVIAPAALVIGVVIGYVIRARYGKGGE